MYLLLKEVYSPTDGMHYYREMERINNLEVAKYLSYKYNQNNNYCIIRVGFLNDEYQETFIGNYDPEIMVTQK